MTAADGTVVSTTKIVDHGPDDKRWTLVILGDGFKAAELPTYHQKVDDLVQGLKAISPFDTLWDRINVHRIDVSSTDSGIDNPAACGDGSVVNPAVSAKTYFDSTFCFGGQVRRSVGVNEPLVLTTINARVNDWEAAFVLVNSTDIGGAASGVGARIGTYTLHPVYIAGVAHELGHIFGLQDEYSFLSKCVGDIAGHDRYTGAADEPNITKETRLDKIKWRHLITSRGALPIMKNPKCTECDARPSIHDAGTVGLFEGAATYHCGVFRPTFDCGMRTVSPLTPFCAVCVEAITKKIISRSQSSTCFVATAVYGDSEHPDVHWLRQWRDRHLMGGLGRPAMRMFVAGYAVVGPRAASAARRHPAARSFLRRWVFPTTVSILRRIDPREG